MKIIFLMAWRNIWRNKRRSVITISSIFCAVFFAVFARSFQIGVYNKMIENMVGMYTGYLQVHQDGFWKEQSIDNSFILDAELIDLISTSENIGNFNERLESFALTVSNNLTKGAIVIGVDFKKEDQLMKLHSKMKSGEFPSDTSNVILLSEGLAEYYTLEVGDSLILMGQGYHGSSANGIFHIQGIIRLPVPNLNDRMIFMPLLAAQELYDAPGRLTSLVLQVDEPSNLSRTKNSLLKKMDLDKYELLDWRSLLPELVQTIQADSAGGIIILGILYMIITLGILGTLLMMTAERMYEFGILVSIGMKKGKLIITLLIESLMMGLLGVILGVIGVSPVRYYFYLNPIRLQEKAAESVEAFGFEPIIPASLDMNIALNHSCIVLLIVLLCSIYPIITILRLQPVKAMKT
jgi:ABC-type lipoprotein release transport system permease subunit